MTNPNPYAPPTSHENEPVRREAPSAKRLWIAYAIAPMVAPLLAAIAVFVAAYVYQATHPDDVELNPLSLIFVPLGMLIVGVPSSYGVAGVLGMPIAFWLQRLGKLNGYTVHAAALAWAALLGLGLPIAGVLLPSPEPSTPDPIDLVKGAFVGFLAIAPFILLSATTFWLLGVRRRLGHRPSSP